MNSIKWQIQIWHGSVLSLVVIILLTIVSVHERTIYLKLAEQQLMSLAPLHIHYHFPLTRPDGSPHHNHRSDTDGRRSRESHPPHPQQGGSPRDIPKHAPPPRPESDQSFFESGSYYHGVWNNRGDLIAGSENLPSMLSCPTESKDGWNFRTRDGYREMILGHPSGYVGIIGTDLSTIQASYHQFLFWIWSLGFIVIAFAWGVGWYLSSYSLRSLKKISETASEIANGDLDRQIDSEMTSLELKELSEILNGTFARLSRSLKNQIRFTADASHELCTPLAVMLTEIQSGLRKERSSTEYQDRLKVCHKAVQHMRELVGSLMELARFDAGDVELHQTDTSIHVVIEECIYLLSPRAQAKNIQIETDFERVIANVDDQKLHQVVINLLSNAIDHSPENSKISISLERLDGRFQIRVKDSGVGIPESLRIAVFERFFQSDSSRNKGGFGLGLSICKAIVELHEGRIFVDSEVTQGACFVVEMSI